MTAQQFVRGDVAVLVPAAGLGTRLGPGIPKALRSLNGTPLLVHAVRRMAAAPSTGHVVVAAPPGMVPEVIEVLDGQLPDPVQLTVVEGGADRRASVAAALAATPAGYRIILVHDAARAFAPTDLAERVATAVRAGHRAVIPVMPVADTVKQVDESGTVVRTLDRALLRAVQTPQGFDRDTLLRAHRAPQDVSITDDAGLVEALKFPVHCVNGAEEALKITRPHDLLVAQLLSSEQPAERTLS